MRSHCSRPYSRDLTNTVSGFLFATLVLLVPLSSVGAKTKCVDCHDAKKYPMSKNHRDDGCSGCHENAGFREDADLKKKLTNPHKPDMPLVKCGGCHDGELDTIKKSIHGKVFKNPNKMCKNCHGQHPTHSIKPIEVYKTCGKCHEDEEFTKKYFKKTKDPIKTYLKSTHGRELLHGNKKSATCTHCHGAHKIYKPSDPRSKINRNNVPKTCGGCHKKVAKVYNDSIHGALFLQGKQKSPVCTSCHGEHFILSSKDTKSLVNKKMIARFTCAQCHESQMLFNEGLVDKTKVKSFRKSYHGLALKMGDVTAANCTSCHGVHNIYSMDDKRSLVHKDNLLKTCKSCHKNANEYFVKGRIHGPGNVEPGIQRAKQLVYDIYFWLIVGFIIFALAHNGLDYIYRIRLKMRAHKREKKLHDRFPLFARFVHWSLISSFTVLVYTGFSLRYEMLQIYSNTFRSLLHRISALVFVAVCLIHMVHVIVTKGGRKFIWAMVPVWRDVKEFYQAVSFYLGAQKKKVVLSDFSYIEKFEYLALVWGSIVMIITGFLLWFPELFSQLRIPRWGVDIAGLIHFMEAILATVAIILWHLYHVQLKEGSAGNISWIDGKLSEEEHRNERELTPLDTPSETAHDDGPAPKE